MRTANALVLAALFIASTRGLQAQASLADSAKLLSEQAIASEREGTAASRDSALVLWTRAAELFRRVQDIGGEAEALHNIGRLAVSKDTLRSHTIVARWCCGVRPGTAGGRPEPSIISPARSASLVNLTPHPNTID